MNKKVLLALIFSLIATTSHAAPVVKMTGLKATTMIELSSDPNDQVSTLLTSPTLIAIVGSSGGDGFIAAYDRTASTMQWNLHLGGAGDDIATAATKDSLGTFWVAGVSSTAPQTTSAPTIPAGTLNPAGVIPDTSTALPYLNKLDIWKVSAQGEVLKSFSTIMDDVILPQYISVKSGKVSVSGAIASHASDHFLITLASDGSFSSPKISSASSVATSPVKEIKTTLSVWRSFTTSQAIKGIPSWKPKTKSHVLIRYDAKSKAVVAGYVTTGEILDFSWEKSIGIIGLISYPTGYGIAIIK